MRQPTPQQRRYKVRGLGRMIGSAEQRAEALRVAGAVERFPSAMYGPAAEEALIPSRQPDPDAIATLQPDDPDDCSDGDDALSRAIREFREEFMS
jgi:hypothetical protein